MSADKKNIRSLDLDQLKDFFVKNNEPKFRAKQVYEWLWKKSVMSFDQMTNLPQKNILLLKENFTIHHAIITEAQRSNER